MERDNEAEGVAASPGEPDQAIERLNLYPEIFNRPRRRARPRCIGIPVSRHPQTGKPPSHSATPELLQLLTSAFSSAE
jgi:hypothetical protein